MLEYNPFDLTGKNIIITGASSGIGKEIAKLLSKCGARLALVARNEQKLLDTKDILAGDNHLSYSFDLTNLGEIQKLIRDIRQDMGYIDGFVHSAGISKTIPQGKTTPEHYELIFKTNFFSFAELVRQLSKKGVINSEGGSIIAISSIVGIIPSPGLAAYASSKSALNHLIKILANELALKRIRVNSICPGMIKTDMWDEYTSIISEEQKEIYENQYSFGIGEPSDVANAVAFLMSQTGRWITGTSLILDGGYSIKRS